MQRPFPNSPAKLRRFFFPAKFSGEKIFRTLNLPATPPVIARGASAPTPGLRPDTRRRPFRSRKRVQNYNFPPYPPNFPRTFFGENFTPSSAHRTHSPAPHTFTPLTFFRILTAPKHAMQPSIHPKAAQLANPPDTASRHRATLLFCRIRFTRARCFKDFV